MKLKETLEYVCIICGAVVAVSGNIPATVVGIATGIASVGMELRDWSRV